MVFDGLHPGGNMSDVDDINRWMACTETPWPYCTKKGTDVEEAKEGGALTPPVKEDEEA
jgi:hypothetical protein